MILSEQRIKILYQIFFDIYNNNRPVCTVMNWNQNQFYIEEADLFY